MRITRQRQNLIVASAIFGIGVAVGFTWGLLRPHPLSDYQRVLAEDSSAGEA